MSLICIRINNHFQINSFAHSLALKLSFGATLGCEQAARAPQRACLQATGIWPKYSLFLFLSYEGYIHTLTFPDTASQHAAFQSKLCTFLRFRWCPVNES